VQEETFGVIFPLTQREKQTESVCHVTLSTLSLMHTAPASQVKFH